MKDKITVKKLKLAVIGDKDEKDRVYQYIRDGQYNQYKALNLMMSEVGTLYYHCGRDIKSEDWKNNYYEIFKIKNPQWADVEMPRGIGMQSTVSQKVKNDFSTALKNGLAKGERSLPYYKRTMPLMIPGRFIKFYSDYTDEGNKFYGCKMMNNINFKVVVGSRGKNSEYLMSLLANLDEGKNENYHICQSGLTIKDNKEENKENKKEIILILTVKIKSNDDEYIPEKGKVLSVALSYDSPLVAAVSGSDEIITIKGREDFVSTRLKMQETYRNLKISLKKANGGKGRKRKLSAQNKFKSREKNYASLYNHELSKAVVECAKSVKAETIVLEEITAKDINRDRLMLRNWSYYQLCEYITYKAKNEGIAVIPHKRINTCCNCHKDFEEKSIFADDIRNKWGDYVSFKCPECGKEINYAHNKARCLLTVTNVEE